MQNHTDTFVPPQGDNRPPSGKEVFNAMAALVGIAVGVLSAPWALLVRKPGTVGTRIYFWDCGMASLMLIALAQWPPIPITVHLTDQHSVTYPAHMLNFLFFGHLLVMNMMHLYHVLATWGAAEHVHTMSIGKPRWSVEFELLLGLLTASTCYYLELVPYAIFIATCSAALVIREVMINERDRRRTVEMQDALYEQQYMMNLYEQRKRNGY